MRGYEVEPETYASSRTRVIERARPTPSRAIDLELFVRLDEIDPVSSRSPTSSSPPRRRAALRAARWRALAEAGRVGIGRFVPPTKPHLVALRPRRGRRSRPRPRRRGARDPRPSASLARTSVMSASSRSPCSSWRRSRRSGTLRMFADEYREELLPDDLERNAGEGRGAGRTGRGRGVARSAGSWTRCAGASRGRRRRGAPDRGQVG